MRYESAWNGEQDLQVTAPGGRCPQADEPRPLPQIGTALVRPGEVVSMFFTFHGSRRLTAVIPMAEGVMNCLVRCGAGRAVLIRTPFTGMEISPMFMGRRPVMMRFPCLRLTVLC